MKRRYLRLAGDAWVDRLRNGNLTESPALYTSISIFGYLFLCLNLLFFCYLLGADSARYARLTSEDAGVEYLGFFLLLLTGLILLCLARRDERNPAWLRWIYLFFGCAFVWAAGEEVSWGQRLFGFETPDFLRAVNAQGEFNIHNIEKKFFNRLYDRGTILLCLTTGALFLYKKASVFKIPLPSITLMCCFLLVSCYRHHWKLWSPDFFQLGYLLLLIFTIFALLSRQHGLFITVVMTLALMLAITAFNHAFSHQFIGKNSAHEVREYLFSFVCFCYACEIFLRYRRRAFPDVAGTAA